MLTKLFKYDIKATARIFLLLHLLYLLACILGRFLYVGRLDFNDPTPKLASSLIIFIGMFTLLFFAVSFGVYILILLRFYKNLFTDEGYLTWTLPATPGQHLWAKTLSGTFWFVLDFFIIIAGIFILVSSPNVTAAFAPLLPEIGVALGMPVSSYIIVLGTFTLLSILGSAIMMYFCVAVGQLFPSHRVLGAIIAYFMLTFVVQIIMLSIMIAVGLFPTPSMFSSTSVTYSLDMGRYLWSTIKLSGISMVVVTVLEYIVTLHIMKKKVNLI